MNRLLFANIPHSCTEEELRTWIKEIGFEVAALKLIRNGVNESSPSFAQVQLTTTPINATALQTLDRRVLGNHRLYVRRGRSPLDD
jgi:hypothetical protein